MIDRLLTLPERRTTAVILTVGLIFLAAYSASLVLRPRPGGRVVIGDALHHYVQLRSVVFDRDLHFRNEYVRLYNLRGGEEGTEWVYEDTPTGHVRNLMPFGPALVWMPLFLLVTAGVWIGNLLGAGYPLDGYGRLFQAAAGLSGVIAATAGVWISFAACRRLFTARAAAWGTLVMWLSSSAIYYSVISPTYSHAASLLASSLFWYAWIATRERRTTVRFAVLGALAGVAALMRWQDAILVLPLALDALLPDPGQPASATTGIRRLAAAGAAAAAAFVPQMIAWWILYGQPLAIPQGPAFMKWTEPALVEVLFSDFHGLFTWTPVVVAGCVGLVWVIRRDRRTGLAMAVFLAISWYVNAAVADWWAGEAFGARRFVSCFPVFAAGAAALVDRWLPSTRRVAIAGAVITLHTFLLLVQYQAFMHGLRQVAPYPKGAYNLYVARFVVPIDLAREWLTR